MKSLIQLHLFTFIGLLLFGLSVFGVEATSTAKVENPYDASILSSIQNLITPYESTINVNVSNGIVYINGQMNSITNFEELVAKIEATTGVVDVNIKNLTIENYSASLGDALINAKVKGALLQSDILGQDMTKWPIKIETKNSQIFLTGNVSSQEKKQALLDLIHSLTTITLVEENITVSGS